MTSISIDWAMARRETPGLESSHHETAKIHFNAMQSLQSRTTIDAAKCQLDLEAEMYSSSICEEAAAVGIDQAHGAVAEIIDCEASKVFFCQGDASRTVTTLTKALALKDHHAVVVYGVPVNPAKLPCSILQAPIKDDGGLDIERLEHKLDDSVQLVIVPYVDPVNAKQLCTDQLGDLVHRSGARLIIDATAALGCVPLDTNQYLPDILIASADGYLRGPRGITACISWAGEVAEALRLDSRFCGVGEGYTEAAEGFSTLAFVVAFGVACRYFSKLGTSNVQHRVCLLTREFQHGLESIAELSVLSQPDSSNSVYAVRFRGHKETVVPQNELSLRLAEVGVLLAVDPMDPEVLIAYIHYYNTLEEVRDAIQRIRTVVTDIDCIDDWVQVGASDEIPIEIENVESAIVNCEKDVAQPDDEGRDEISVLENLDDDCDVPLMTLSMNDNSVPDITSGSNNCGQEINCCKNDDGATCCAGKIDGSDELEMIQQSDLLSCNIEALSTRGEYNDNTEVPSSSSHEVFDMENNEGQLSSSVENAVQPDVTDLYCDGNEYVDLLTADRINPTVVPSKRASPGPSIASLTSDATSTIDDSSDEIADDAEAISESESVNWSDSDRWTPNWTDLSIPNSSGDGDSSIDSRRNSMEFTNIEAVTTTFEFDNPLFGMNMPDYSDCDDDDMDRSLQTSPATLENSISLPIPIALKHHAIRSRQMYHSQTSSTTPQSDVSMGLHEVLSDSESNRGSPMMWRSSPISKDYKFKSVTNNVPVPSLTLEDLRSSTPPPIRSSAFFCGLGNSVRPSGQHMEHFISSFDSKVDILSPQICHSL